MLAPLLEYDACMLTIVGFRAIPVFTGRKDIAGVALAPTPLERTFEIFDRAVLEDP